jgi:DNA-binding transcriptional regulator YiaG
MTAEEIKAIRHALGLTQEQFADRLEVARSTIARWETGVRAPQSKYVVRRLEALAKKAQKR